MSAIFMTSTLGDLVRRLGISRSWYGRRQVVQDVLSKSVETVGGYCFVSIGRKGMLLGNSSRRFSRW